MDINDIYNEDCRNTMSGMPDSFVDLTITSPPYDNLRTYKDDVDKIWDEDVWEQIIKELYRVTKKGGVVVWVVGDATIKGSETGTSFKQALYAKECGFNLHDTMIYYRWSGPMNHNRYEQEFEYMFVWSKGKPKTFNPIRVECKWHKLDSDRTGQKYVVHDEKNRKLRSGINRTNILKTRIKGNLWKINNSSQKGERYGHPAPFPEKLAKDHIISWSNPGDLVYDPFMGSGTTAKMAILHGRNYIGSELVKEYCDIAYNRIIKAEGGY